MASRVATQLSGVAKLLVTAALTLLIALAMSGVHTTAKASTPPLTLDRAPETQVEEHFDQLDDLSGNLTLSDILAADRKAGRRLSSH